MSDANKSSITGHVAQQNVYSATIENRTAGKIRCVIEYRTLAGSDNEIVEVEIDNPGEQYKCERKVHSTRQTDSSYSNIYPKVISSIKVRKGDGSTLEIKAPFDHVPYGDVHKWKFVVDDNQIHSEEI